MGEGGRRERAVRGRGEGRERGRCQGGGVSGGGVGRGREGGEGKRGERILQGLFGGRRGSDVSSTDLPECQPPNKMFNGKRKTN